MFPSTISSRTGAAFFAAISNRIPAAVELQTELDRKTIARREDRQTSQLSTSESANLLTGASVSAGSIDMQLVDERPTCTYSGAKWA